MQPFVIISCTASLIPSNAKLAGACTSARHDNNVLNDEGQHKLLRMVILGVITKPKVNRVVYSTEIMLGKNNIEHPSGCFIEVLKVVIKLELLIQIKTKLLSFDYQHQ